MTKEFEFTEMEPGKHDLQFHCEWAVFPKANPGSSLCYVTSEERAKWISDRLNELLHLRSVGEEAVADDVEAARPKAVGFGAKCGEILRATCGHGWIGHKDVAQIINDQLAKFLSEHGVSSPVGEVSSLTFEQKPTKSGPYWRRYPSRHKWVIVFVSEDILLDPASDLKGDWIAIQEPSETPSPSEHVRQMERALKEIVALKPIPKPCSETDCWPCKMWKIANDVLSSQDGNSPATSVSSPDQVIEIDEDGKVHDPLGQVPPRVPIRDPGPASPVSSVERDKKDLGEPGGV